MADDPSSSASTTKSRKLSVGAHVVHVPSGERYVVMAVGAEELDAGNGPEPTYVLLPEQYVTHPQPGSLLELVD